MLRLVLALLVLPAAAPAATITFSEDLRIDTVGTEAEFGRIYNVAVDPEGTVYAVDAGFGVVQVFDARGEHLRSFGQMGEGPGDLPRRGIQIAIDADGNLLIAGSRSSISRIDPWGDLVGSIPLTQPPNPGSVFELADGTVGLSSTWSSFGVEDPPAPRLLHLFDPGGDPVGSFAESSWWKEEYDPAWGISILGAFAATDPGDDTILFVQTNPFELRRYRADGSLIARTDAGLREFVPDPRVPEVEGNSVHFFSPGGSAGRPILVTSGHVFVRATRIVPEQNDPSTWTDDFQPEWESRLAVFDRSLRLVATLDDDVPRIVASDPAGGLWAIGSHDDGIQYLVRYTWTITD